MDDVTSLGTPASPPAPAGGLKEILADPVPDASGYHPFMDTLRLYAGWLLAWYVALYALAGYQETRSLPWKYPFLQTFLRSPLAATVSFALFAYLLLTSVHRRLGRRASMGIVLGLLWMAGVTVFWRNVV